MAHLEIRAGDGDGRPVAGSNAEILLDGEPVDEVLGLVTQLSISVRHDDAIRAGITFLPDKITVDAEVMANIEALAAEHNIGVNS